MFKRRRTDGSEAMTSDAEAASTEPAEEVNAPDEPDSVPPAAGLKPAPASSSLVWIPGKPSDGGLGVPPFRPAAARESEFMNRVPSNSGPAAPPPPAGTSRSVIGRGPLRDADRRMLVVGRGISLQGTVQDAERLVVEGTVEASSIQATELVVSHGGLFKGEVEVEEAEIAGTMDGTLTVSGSLIVRNTGRVLGTARCRRLQVEDGGQISGRVEMTTELPSALEAPRLIAESMA